MVVCLRLIASHKFPNRACASWHPSSQFKHPRVIWIGQGECTRARAIAHSATVRRASTRVDGFDGASVVANAPELAQERGEAVRGLAEPSNWY